MGGASSVSFASPLAGFCTVVAKSCYSPSTVVPLLRRLRQGASCGACLKSLAESRVPDHHTACDDVVEHLRFCLRGKNGRLAMVSIIGMFFQDGLTGSAWGDWA